MALSLALVNPSSHQGQPIKIRGEIISANQSWGCELGVRNTKKNTANSRNNVFIETLNALILKLNY